MNAAQNQNLSSQVAVSKLIAAVLFGALGFGSYAASGAEARFSNHLRSTPMVSPAQLYQVRSLKTDFQLGFQNDSRIRKTQDIDELSSSLSGTDLFAAGVYHVGQTGLRVGMLLGYVSGTAIDEAAVRDVGGDILEIRRTDADLTNTLVAPQLAFHVGRLAFGAAYEARATEVTVRDASSDRDNVDTFSLGGLFANGPVEAGLTFRSAADPKGEEDKVQAAIPEELTAHGRYALTGRLTAGGFVTHRSWRDIDSLLYKDQQSYVGTAEYSLSALKFEGDLKYNTSYYKEKENMTAQNIATVGLGAAGLYPLNERADVGGAVAYAFGSDKNDVVEVSTEQLSLSVRGNLLF